MGYKVAIDLYRSCLSADYIGPDVVMRWASGAFAVLPYTDWDDIECLMIQYGEAFDVEVRL